MVMSLLNDQETAAYSGVSTLDRDVLSEIHSLTFHQRQTCSTAEIRRSSVWVKVYSFLLICLIASASNGCGSGVVTASTGVLRFTSEVVNFGDVPVGDAQNSDVGILNAGSTPVLISALDVAGQTFSTSGQHDAISIPAGGTHSLRLSFAPTSSTDFSGQLTLMSAAAEPMAMIGMHGRGGKTGVAQLAASSSSMDFGTVIVGSTKVQPLTLTATGTSPVTISSAALNGTDFSLVGAQTPLTLSPGQAVTLQVQLKPPAAGSLTSQLAITSNASGGRTDLIALTGLGAVPESRQLTIGPAALAFGSVTVGTAKVLSVALTSTGPSPVTVNAASISGSGYSLIGAAFPMTLSPAQTVNLQVQFAPTAAGDGGGQLAVSSNSSGGRVTSVALGATGIAAPNPQLSLSLTRLSFGNVTIDAPATLAVVLTSTGTSPVTVNAAGISGTGYSLIGAAFPIILSPAQTVTLQVKFAPTTAGSASGQLTVNSNFSGGSTAAVALSGTGIAAPNPQLSLSLTKLNFSNITINAPATLPVVLTSTGTSAVTVNSASLSGSGYTLIGAAFPITLSPGQTATLQVKFAPTVAGGASGQLTISSNSSSGSTAAVALSGTGLAAANPLLSLSLSQLTFGNVTINTPTTLPIVLTSTGTSAVTINAATLSGTGYNLIGTAFPITLSPGQTATLQVKFAPTVAGGAAGQLTISSNSSTGNTATVTLSGTGIAAANPQLSLSLSQLSFGNVTINAPATLPIVLTSTGTSAVTVNSASLSGSGYTLIGAAFPITLSPGQTATLQVKFAPTVAGGASGQLTISSNSSGGSTAAVALSGTGLAAANPQLSLSLTQLSFGNVTIDVPATLAIVLTSTGTSPVTVNAASISGTGYSLIGAALPITLSPGQTVTLQVKFAPTVAGGASGQVIVSSNSSGGSSAAVALSGTGIAAPNPQLSLSLTRLSFGNVTINAPATLSLILTSTGSSALTVNAPTITGTGFTLVSPNPRVTLDPTQSLTLQIQFDPRSIGASTGQLTINSNSLGGTSVLVALSGTAIALNPILTASPATLSFGSIAVNTASILPIILRSTGTTAVTVSSAAISGTGYTFAGGTFPITLEPGQTATLQIQLKPGTSGDTAGQLTLRSDSVNGSTVVVPLSGTGLATGHQVDLTWDAAAASSSPVTGYHVYRSIGSAAAVLLNTAPAATTSFTDTTVVSSNSYNYVVKSVDASGSESVASNQIQLAIP
jgi:hypothetical protein